MPEDGNLSESSENEATSNIKNNYRNHILKNLDNFLELTADNIVVPRNQIVSLAADLSLQKSLEIIQKHLYSNYPVHKKEDSDEIVGLLSIKDLIVSLNKSKFKKISQIMKPVFYVSFSEPLWQVLQKFQESKIKTAIAVNEYGEADGMICAEDILEELVGDIADEHDIEKLTFIEKENNKYIVSGQYELVDLIEIFNFKIDSEEPETISGYISHSLGRIPDKGEIFKINDIKFQIIESDNKKITLVSMELDKLK